MKLYHRCVPIGRNSIYRVLYYPWFQASAGSLGMNLLQIRGDCCACVYVLQEGGERLGVWGTCAQLLRKTYVLLMFQAAS